MPHDEMSTTEGEYVGKEKPDEQAKSVTHITNNVLIQQMDVYPGGEPGADERRVYDQLPRALLGL